MGWDGAGGYTRQHNFSADASAGIKILALRVDQELNDFASAMTIAWARDGQNVPTQNIPMGGRTFINVAAATSVNNFMRVREFIENVPIFMTDSETSADRISVSAQYFTSVSANQAPGDGTRIFVRAGSNKSSAALYLNGHSANVKYQDGNRIGPALVSGGVYEFVYSSVDSSWKLPQPDDGRTPEEISAGVTPSNHQYPPGHYLRYGGTATESQMAAIAVDGAYPSAAGTLSFATGGILRGKFTGTAATGELEIRAADSVGDAQIRFRNAAGTTKGFLGFTAAGDETMSMTSLEDFRLKFRTGAGDGTTFYNRVHMHGNTDQESWLAVESPRVDNIGGCYIRFVEADPTVTKGYIGYTSTSDNDIDIINTETDAHIDLQTAGTGVVKVQPPLALVDGITAPSVLAGFALIYVDAADGDLKVKFPDGTTKTIVVDT